MRVSASTDSPELAPSGPYGRLIELLKKPRATDCAGVESAAYETLSGSDARTFREQATALIDACSFFFEIGKSQQGIKLGIAVAEAAANANDVQIQRRLFNILGLQYADTADFASSMKYLELAVVLARKIGDADAELACLANVATVLQEMGHYRQAISMAERVVRSKRVSPMITNLKLQCASNALFAAHRIGDTYSAAKFLEEGQKHLGSEVAALRLAFFERGRVLYLIDYGSVEEAKRHLEGTCSAIASAMTPRTKILLHLCASLCEWASGQKNKARADLKTLYIETKISLFYHHFVLQALVKVFSDGKTQAELNSGLNYARELVEFTTSVKKAKFYKQLKSHRSEKFTSKPTPELGVPSVCLTLTDPFAGSKDWMSDTNIGVPSDDEAPRRRDLAKHEELTVIHEEMAKLRVEGLRREIRTDAVDTAENWAIAAEFFDDETGRHCYRVGHLASKLAKEVGMSDEFCVQIEHAARLHDIGKIAVNEVILLKPGPLDAAETAAMRLHTEVGAQILSGSSDPTLVMATEVARSHHEWWNGQGYPQKLSGTSIPISARISAFADVYDALTHARAYKTAWTHERAIDEIKRMAGTQFDPNLLDPFCHVLERYRADLESEAIPGFKDMDSNSLIASRRRLMDTIAAN